MPGSASLVTNEPLFITPDMENISDISLIEVETDCEDKVDPEKAPASSTSKKEKSPVWSGSRLKRPSAPGRSKRTLKRKSRPRTQGMIEEGRHWLDESGPESLEDNCF